MGLLPDNFSSPPWSANSKRLVWISLGLMALFLLYQVRGLLLPVVIAIVIAYLIEPIVKWLVRRLRVSRLVAIIMVYLVIVAALISIPATTIPRIVNQANNFINNIPFYLRQLGEVLEEPITIYGDIEIPIDELSLDQIYDSFSSNIVQIVQTLGGQSLSIFGSVASATLTTVGWILVVLFLSFYMVKDHDQLFRALLRLAPPDHHADIRRLGREISVTWNAFLRGQFVLCVVVGTMTFVIALVIGLPNALLLAIISGLAEFVPNLGPALASIPAMLIAVVQHEQSWLGSSMSPLLFALLILGIYGLVQQIENYFLTPRIMGHHLKIHPLVVFVAALAGARVAGIIGILLAAPVLATARLVFTYIYHKLTDQVPFATQASAETQAPVDAGREAGSESKDGQAIRAQGLEH